MLSHQKLAIFGPLVGIVSHIDANVSQRVNLDHLETVVETIIYFFQASPIIIICKPGLRRRLVELWRLYIFRGCCRIVRYFSLFLLHLALSSNYIHHHHFIINYIIKNVDALTLSNWCNILRASERGDLDCFLRQTTPRMGYRYQDIQRRVGKRGEDRYNSLLHDQVSDGNRSNNQGCKPASETEGEFDSHAICWSKWAVASQ